MRSTAHHHLYEPRCHPQLCEARRRAAHRPQSAKLPQRSLQRIQQVVDWFAASPEHNIIYTHHNEKQNKDVYMVALRDADGTLIGYYEKHEFRSPETMERYAF